MSTKLGLVSGRRTSPNSSGENHSARDVLSDIVGTALGVVPERLVARQRGTATTAFARQVAIYLARTRLGLSFTDAAHLFGRDRTTAAHACRRIEEARDDAELDRLIERLDRAVQRATAPGRVA